MKLSAALLALALSAPIGALSPAKAQELTRTELTPAQATAAAELLLDAMKQKKGDAVHAALADPIQDSVCPFSKLQFF